MRSPPFAVKTCRIKFWCNLFPTGHMISRTESASAIKISQDRNIKTVALRKGAAIAKVHIKPNGTINTKELK